MGRFYSNGLRLSSIRTTPLLDQNPKRLHEFCRTSQGRSKILSSGGHYH